MGDRHFDATTATAGADLFAGAREVAPRNDLESTADALSQSLREDGRDSSAKSAQNTLNECAPDLVREPVSEVNVTMLAEAINGIVRNTVTLFAGALFLRLHLHRLLREHGRTDRLPIHPFCLNDLVDFGSAVVSTTTATTDGRAADELHVPKLSALNAALVKGLHELFTQKNRQKKGRNVQYETSHDVSTKAMKVADIILNADASFDRAWENQVMRLITVPKTQAIESLRTDLAQLYVSSKKCALLRSALTLMKAAMDKESGGSQSSSPLCNWIGQELVDMENAMHEARDTCAARASQFQCNTSPDDSDQENILEQLFTLLSLTWGPVLTESYRLYQGHDRGIALFCETFVPNVVNTDVMLKAMSGQHTEELLYVAILCASQNEPHFDFFLVPYTPGGSSFLSVRIDANKTTFSTLANAISSLRIRVDPGWQPPVEAGVRESNTPQQAVGALFFEGDNVTDEFVFDPQIPGERNAVLGIDVKSLVTFNNVKREVLPRNLTVVKRYVVILPRTKALLNRTCRRNKAHLMNVPCVSELTSKLQSMKAEYDGARITADDSVSLFIDVLEIEALTQLAVNREVIP